MTDALLNLFPYVAARTVQPFLSLYTIIADMDLLYVLECSSEARVYHLGIFREKVSLHPVECEFWHLSLSALI